MRFVVVILILFAVSTVQAQSALIGKRLVSRGDDVERLRGVGIKPDRLDRIDADEHSPAMEVWTYIHGARSIVVWLVDGKVVQVHEQTVEK